MERQKISIRNFREPDRFAVVDLIEESGLVNARPPGYVHGILDRRQILVAETSESMVGAVLVTPKDYKQQSEIHILAVHSNFQRLGIGSFLVMQAERILKKDGVTNLGVYAQNAQPHLINFYGRLGFELVDADGLMRKRLS